MCSLTSTLVFQLDKLSSPSISPPPAQLMPSHLSRLKITLKLPTQTQKLACICHDVYKDKVFDSDIESEDDDDDEPHGSNRKRPLTTCHCQMSSASMAPTSLPSPLMPVQAWSMVHAHALSLSLLLFPPFLRSTLSATALSVHAVTPWPASASAMIHRRAHSTSCVGMAHHRPSHPSYPTGRLSST